MRANIIEPTRQKPKKTRRIRWQDQLRPSSPFSTASNKSIGKGSVKGRMASSTGISFSNTTIQHEVSNKDLDLLYQSVNFKAPPKGGRDKKSDLENNWEDSSEYQQLKEMSRTNFNDHRYMSSKLRRRGSLKPRTSQVQVQKSSSAGSIQSINALMGIYGSRTAKGLSKSGSAQSFLTGLRNFNKLSMSRA
jgi:hypothetical protein